MHFRISGLEAARFAELRAMTDEALASLGAQRHVMAEEHAAPCRISLLDAAVGETVILTSFEHQSAHSPYRAAGPIFVREAARETAVVTDTVPDCVARRLISVRAYDARDCIRDAEVIDGKSVAAVARRYLEDCAVAYLHLHYARRGCFACRVDRA